MNKITQKFQNGVAVFARNHKAHLHEGLKLSQKNPDALFPFRSVIAWATAKKAVHFKRPISFLSR